MAYVALTFDDGPWPGGTDRLLDVLADHGAAATFFIWGPQARAHPDLVRATVAAGHSVQPHCVLHQRQDNMSAEEIESDLETILACLEDLQSPRPEFWRPAFGVHRAGSAHLARRRGLELTGWHLDPSDYAGRTADDMFNQIRAQLGYLSGDIAILLHDCPLETHQWTFRKNVDATVELVRRLLVDGGHTFGPLREATHESLLTVAD